MRIGHSVLLATFLLICAAAPLASAQSNLVTQHYREYSAALYRGDLEAATSAARAALDASIARDGNGGLTAVLSLNLATAHLASGRTQDALLPAQQALDLAHAGARGVDPNMAQVILSRILLELEPTEARAAELGAVLLSDDAGALPSNEIYPAASQLGNWALANADYALARQAWALAAADASGDLIDERIGFGRARTREAVAIIMSEIALRGSRRLDRNESLTAHSLLNDALLALNESRRVESPTGELTIAQRTYAETQAWMNTLEARVSADGYPVPDRSEGAQGDADGASELAPLQATARPRCLVRPVARPAPAYPDYDQIATVVLFVRINSEGQVIHHEIAASAGSSEFADAVERVASRWRMARRSDSAPGCRMESSLLIPVNFVVN